MNRLSLALASALFFTAAGAASAADVAVTIGPELQHHAKAYGPRELDQLRQDLSDSVQKALAKPGAAPVVRADLVIQSATPNRPTFNELSATPGLSLRSKGLGGAVVTGTVTLADGTTQPLSYRWRETDLRQVRAYTTWTDAQRTFDWIARDLAHGKIPNDGRTFRPDLASNAAFDELGRLR